MAQIHGRPGKEWGEQRVFDALASLPDEFIIYAQPILTPKQSPPRYPDFVIIYPKLGVIVLEVKDWVEIVGYDRRSAQVRRQATGRVESETSPVEQARSACYALADMLKEDPILSDNGKLAFPYAFTGFLPHLSDSIISDLSQAWGHGLVFGKEDLQPQRLAEKLATLPVPFRRHMTEREVKIARAIINPEIIRRDSTGKIKGILDAEQESIAKEPLARPKVEFDLETRAKQLEAEMPPEAASLKSSANVRLVRGFAGTGKTDVLVLRTHYLHEQDPDLDILVTTFNDPVYQNRLAPELQALKSKVDVIKFATLCAGIYRREFGWRQPQETRGLVAKLAEDYPLITQLGLPFVADEFAWIKETGRTEREEYLSRVREGRGGVEGRTLGRKLKGQIFDLFEIYQKRLQQMHTCDWTDMYEKTWDCLQKGITPEKLYDVILIDEAQHFAPTWMRIIKEFLKPAGNLFICDDPSQSVYRHYSWLQKGVEVRGRTRWLRVPYRNTRQIFEAAYTLIANDPIAQKLLAESGEPVKPELDNSNMREGPRPQVHDFSSWQAEQEFVSNKIQSLVSKAGVLPGEIGILHEEKHVLDRYRSIVPRGVQLYELKRQTGLEYRVIFVPQVQKLSDRTVGMSWEEDQSRQRLKFYMTLTRARQEAYLLYQQNWPKPLDPIRPYVEWIQH